MTTPLGRIRHRWTGVYAVDGLDKVGPDELPPDIAALLDIAEAVRLADLDFLIDGLMETGETASALQLIRIREAHNKILGDGASGDAPGAEGLVAPSCQTSPADLNTQQYPEAGE